MQKLAEILHLAVSVFVLNALLSNRDLFRINDVNSLINTLIFNYR